MSIQQLIRDRDTIVRYFAQVDPSTESGERVKVLFHLLAKEIVEHVGENSVRNEARSEEAVVDAVENFSDDVAADGRISKEELEIMKEYVRRHRPNIRDYNLRYTTKIPAWYAELKALEESGNAPMIIISHPPVPVVGTGSEIPSIEGMNYRELQAFIKKYRTPTHYYSAKGSQVQLKQNASDLRSALMASLEPPASLISPSTSAALAAGEDSEMPDFENMPYREMQVWIKDNRSKGNPATRYYAAGKREDIVRTATQLFRDISDIEHRRLNIEGHYTSSSLVSYPADDEFLQSPSGGKNSAEETLRKFLVDWAKKNAEFIDKPPFNLMLADRERLENFLIPFMSIEEEKAYIAYKRTLFV